MKKKLLIVFTGAMEIGGIERSLLGLLDVIDYNQYDVDMFLYAHHGNLFPLLNSTVNLLPEVKELAYLRESLKTKVLHGAFYSAFRRIVDGISQYDSDASWKKVLDHTVANLDKAYDLALSFFQPFDFIREKVDAKVKVGWIHTDYSSISDVDHVKLQEAYSGLDYIVAVSVACRDTFIKMLPVYKEKTIIIENILPSNLVKTQSEECIEDLSGEVKLLSIGRFAKEKNFDNVPAICSRILDSGLNVKWYLIGYGGDDSLIRQRIVEAHMEDHVVILGQKDNPYPYIKACDVYVQPSRFEGKSVAVREAQMLGKPVVITNYATSSSQLEDGVDGVIVPMDNQGCADGITAVLKDKALMKRLSRNCAERDYSNAMEVEKLYALME